MFDVNIGQILVLHVKECVQMVQLLGIKDNCPSHDQYTYNTMRLQDDKEDLRLANCCPAVQSALVTSFPRWVRRSGNGCDWLIS